MWVQGLPQLQIAAAIIGLISIPVVLDIVDPYQ
jgi:hypothetical protein